MRRILTLSLALLAGCSTQPRYEPPKVDLPAAWKATAPPTGGNADGNAAAEGRWWRIYQDPQLDKLVDESFARNADLLVAAARVSEARALLADAQGARLPVIDARASGFRQGVSQRTATFFPGLPKQYSDYRATANLSWELDLFGRLSSNVAAARAELEASEASRDAVRLSLAAQVAKSYFSLRALDEEVDLTRRNVALREDALALQRKRFDAGVISEFDLRQLEAEAAGVRAQLPPLERNRDAEQAALAVLLGRTPREIYEDSVQRSARYDETPGPGMLPAGLPSELLLRRPDLVAAERELAASNARIAAARADMFPSITLTAFGGRESASLSNLFSGPAGIWQFAAGVTQPIFAGGRLEARTDAAKAREQAALAQYQKAIQTAFSEVRTALTAQSRSRESYDAESARAAALADSARLARLRYENGVASQLDVIDAERGLLAAQTSRIEALRAYRAAIADLFRALGG